MRNLGCTCDAVLVEQSSSELPAGVSDGFEVRHHRACALGNSVGLLNAAGVMPEILVESSGCER